MGVVFGLRRASVSGFERVSRTMSLWLWSNNIVYLGMEKILVIGACGQIGVELTLALRKKFGQNNVLASDIRNEDVSLKGTGPFVILDAMNAEATRALVKKEGITTIY